jgi:hypothetical protein
MRWRLIFVFCRHPEPWTATLQCRLVSGSENQMLNQVQHDGIVKLINYPKIEYEEETG